MFQCARKLALVCMPVFFDPPGSASQLSKCPATNARRLRGHLGSDGIVGARDRTPDRRLSFFAVFGLMVCFITFGAYTAVNPFEEDRPNIFAQLCQFQIFFALLSSIALKFSSTMTPDALRNMDGLLTILTFVYAAAGSNCRRTAPPFLSTAAALDSSAALLPLLLTAGCWSVPWVQAAHRLGDLAHTAQQIP